MIKKDYILKKALILTFVSCIFGANVQGVNFSNASLKEKKQTYVVETVSEKACTGVAKEYKKKETVSILAEEAVHEDKIDSFMLTKNEVKSLQKRDGIVHVEPDAVMNGSGKKYKKQNKVNDLQWNLEMINANKRLTRRSCSDKIKVAIIDSGIDYSSDIDVFERKNFIPEHDEISILYEDGSGHGTSVAGIIAAKNNSQGITGINENVELYSAKVLDENNQAPISRVVQAIDWAVEKGVNIINMSLGTPHYSAILHDAVKRAKDKGILIIAAAGNSDEVEYPAAFRETLAVGAIKADGKISEDSVTDENVDVFAPGEQILSTSAFDGVMAFAGTSMAAPHVTGIAATLWQKNTKMPAEFIAGLICSSARKIEDKRSCGKGVVDLDYALQKYSKALIEYQKLAKRHKNKGEISSTELSRVIDRNEHNVKKYANIDIIEGRWTGTLHQELIDSSGISQSTLKVIKRGAVANDNYINGMGTYPYFHGYIGNGGNINYVSSYILLTEMAKNFYDGNYKDPSNKHNLDANSYRKMSSIINASGINGKKWGSLLSGMSVSDKNKAYFMYGMAIHELTDTFAHSAYVNGRRIKHEDIDKNGKEDADDKKYSSNRYDCAQKSARKALENIKGKVGKASDFVAGIGIYTKTFNLYSLSKFARESNSDYSSNKAKFDKMTC